MFEDMFPSIGRRPAAHGPVDLGAVDRAARIIYEALDIIGHRVAPGLTTGKLADEAVSCARHGGVDPGVIIRVSPEDVVWHGLPGPRVLEEGEIVTVDIACSVRGWWADAARTFAVGAVDSKRRNLMRAALAGMKEAVAAMRVGESGASAAGRIAALCRAEGVSLVGEGAGHGLGARLHEVPSITYDGRPHPPLEAGRVYSAEPVFTSGSGGIVISGDGSTATVDAEPAAHYEVTVLLVEHGPQVLGTPDWMDREPC